MQPVQACKPRKAAGNAMQHTHVTYDQSLHQHLVRMSRCKDALDDMTKCRPGRPARATGTDRLLLLHKPAAELVDHQSCKCLLLNVLSHDEQGVAPPDGPLQDPHNVTRCADLLVHQQQPAVLVLCHLCTCVSLSSAGLLFERPDFYPAAVAVRGL